MGGFRRLCLELALDGGTQCFDPYSTTKRGKPLSPPYVRMGLSSHCDLGEDVVSAGLIRHRFSLAPDPVQARVFWPKLRVSSFVRLRLSLLFRAGVSLPRLFFSLDVPGSDAAIWANLYFQPSSRFQSID